MSVEAQIVEERLPGLPLAGITGQFFGPSVEGV